MLYIIYLWLVYSWRVSLTYSSLQGIMTIPLKSFSTGQPEPSECCCRRHKQQRQRGRHLLRRFWGGETASVGDVAGAALPVAGPATARRTRWVKEGAGLAEQPWLHFQLCKGGRQATCRDHPRMPQLAWVFKMNYLVSNGEFDNVPYLFYVWFVFYLVKWEL